MTDIKGIDKVVLLKALWDHSRPAAFFYSYEALSLPIPTFDEKKAQDAVTDCINYFQGRAIKCNLSGDTVESCGYNRNTHEGEFEKIVDSLRM